MEGIKGALEWLKGRKTYVLSLVILAYAVGAYLGYLPEPDKVAAALVIVAGYAITFRAALAKFYSDVPKE